MTEKEIDFIRHNIDVFCCPKCGGDLTLVDEHDLKCLGCGQSYRSDGDIPVLFRPNEWDASKDDVTEPIQAFYEKTPFPNYDDFDDVGSLIQKARRGLFAKLLDEQIPFGTRILECGCGTGQLTNFLSIANRTVIGTDICLNSLEMAHDFKVKNDLDRAHFYQMNLFRPCFKPNTFDLVISTGVLHHTSDPFLGFQTIASLVRPKGYVLIGLYHKYGRLATDIRRLIFKLTRDRFKFLDRYAVSKETSAAKKQAWFMDQYKNPHESKHTFGEVAWWLEETGLTFVHSVPKTVPFVAISESEQLFQPERLGNRFERFLVSIGMVFRGHREGGFFIVIAQRSGNEKNSDEDNFQE